MINQTSLAALPQRSYPLNGNQAHHGNRFHSLRDTATPPSKSETHPNRMDDHYHAHQANALEKATTTLPLDNQKVSSLSTQDLTTASKSSFSMQFTTKEGDVINIGFKAANETHKSSFAYDDGDINVSGFQSETKQSTEFKISIEGDLNEDEQKSLADLMQQMQKVGEEFFSGDPKNAFQQAQKMGFDTEQIAGYSMSLNMEKSVRAVSTYQAISEQQPVDSKTLKNAGDFYNQADKALTGKSDILQKFPEPAQTFNDLAKGIIETISSQFKDFPDIDQHLENLKKLMNLIGAKTLVTPDAPKTESTPDASAQDTAAAPNTPVIPAATATPSTVTVAPESNPPNAVA